MSQAEYDKALKSYLEALEISLEISDRVLEQNCRNKLGIIFEQLADYHQAQVHYQKALEISLEIGDRAGEIASYTNIGSMSDNQADYTNAKEYYEKALKIAVEIGDRFWESASYSNLGNVFVNQAKYADAKEYFEKALKIAVEIGNKSLVGKINGNLGTVLEGFADYINAKEYFEKALKIAIEIGNRAEEETAYSNLGNVFVNQAKYADAKEYFEKALKIAVEIGDKFMVGLIYGNLGIVWIELADYVNAKEYFEKALKIAVEIGDKHGEESCYGNLGNLSKRVADYPKAKEYYEKALKIAVEIGDKVGEKSSYTGLNSVSSNAADYDKAKEYENKALKIAIEIGDKAGIAISYSNLGHLYYNLVDYDKAKEYENKALKIAIEIGDKVGEIASYTNLGNMSHNQGDYDKAKEYHEKALKIAIEIGDKVGEQYSHGNLGRIFQEAGDYVNAKEYFEKALKIAIEIGDRRAKKTFLLFQGILYVVTNQLSLAYNYLEQSIELGESIGGSLIEEYDKIGFYSQGSDAYQFIIPLCVQLNKEEKAFEFAERSKSKAFIDLLAMSNIMPHIFQKNKGRQEELSKLLIQEEEIIRELRFVQSISLNDSRFVSDSYNKSIDLNLSLDNLLRERDSVYNSLEQIVPEYVSLRKAKPLTLDKLQHVLSSDSTILLVEYFLTQDKIFIFVLWRNELQIHTVSLTDKEITQYLDNYRSEVIDYPNFRLSGKPLTNKWLELSDYLIKPISDYLINSKMVYFVPYGTLHHLPLHALLLNNEPLIRTHSVVYSSSASLLQFYKNKGSESLKSCTTFGVAFPDEAKKVAEIFKGKVFEDVSKEQVLQNLKNDILHFSCHGSFNNRDPLSSGIELQDGKLTARDIFDLELDSELVTLSACETGISENKAGDELIGLTRAFVYADVPSLVVSLWNVSAYTTEELMLEFYTNLKNGDQKATALQKAQVKIMSKYKHPFFWAPFILIGDWE